MMEKEKYIHIQNTLTPIILEEGMPGYRTVLDIEDKLNDPDVYNIAITGPYGSGKSTVLKSLRSHFAEKYKFLVISLASLTGEREGELKESELQKVEFSILQQLFYKEKPGTLPNSRFRRISYRPVCHALWFGLAVVGFILSLFVVFEPKWLYVDSLYQFFNLGPCWNLFFDILCSVYLLLCLLIITAYVFRRSLLFSLKALRLKDVSIEIKEDSSVFNQHLEEIVYFFESTEYDVVIIEDLDRFRCPEIFQRLREINYLLQQSEVLQEKHKRIKFIYAVKDDLFKDEERTKFFDYIATVIPVVNPKSSCDKLTQELTNRGYSIDKEVLLDLSEFVDDMRLLKNVVNEFQQYMERLSKSSSPNKEKLLAMIIYKNHHPDDFGDLHYKKGRIYDFISKKSDWIRIIVNKVITPKVQLLEKKKENIAISHAFTMKQWRVLYLAKYREHLSDMLTTIVVDGKDRTIASIADSQELFESLIKSDTISFRYRSYNQTQSSSAVVPFSEIENEVDDRIGYIERKSLVNTSFEEIDREIQLIEEEGERLKVMKLTSVLAQFPEIKEDDEYKSIHLSPLMEHFLQRGYIDETYYDYMTVFDGTTMSLNDRDLLSRIKQNSSRVDYNERINDIDTFVNEIPGFVYSYKSILNFQIADYLENHPTEKQLALNLFEGQLLESTLPPLDFLAKYYRNKNSGSERLWRKFVKSNQSWSKIQSYEKKEYWDILVEAWLRYCDHADITDDIRIWLNKNLGFCIERLDPIGLQHLKDIIYDCQFQDISVLGPIGGSYQGEDVMIIADYILNNKLFQLTENNILLACMISGSPFGTTFNLESLTISDILSSNSDGFKEYVFENIQPLFSSLFIKTVGQEREEGLLRIVNDDRLDEQQKITYLQKQSFCKIHDISMVSDAFKPIALRSNIVYPSWANVLEYYDYDPDGISDELVGFVNSNVEALQKEKYPQNRDSSFAPTFIFGPYGTCFSFEAYQSLLPLLISHISQEDEQLLSAETGKNQVSLLVKNGVLSSGINTALIVSSFGSDIYAEYLCYHFTDFYNHYDEYKKDPLSIALMISNSSSLTNAQRWILAHKVSTDLIHHETTLADALLLLMWNRKDELEWRKTITILSLATDCKEKLLFQKWMLKRNKDDIHRIRAIISTMPIPYKDIGDDNKRPLLPKDFKDYLDYLQPLGIFSSFKEEKKGYRVYHSTK